MPWWTPWCLYPRIICCRHGVSSNTETGQISMQLRFEVTKESANHDIVAHYRKKPSQVRHDRERTEAWRARSNRLGQEPHNDKPLTLPAFRPGVKWRQPMYIRLLPIYVGRNQHQLCQTMDLTVEPLIMENVTCDSSVLWCCVIGYWIGLVINQKQWSTWHGWSL